MKEEVQVYILELLTILMKKIPCEIGAHGFFIGVDGRLTLQMKVQNAAGEDLFQPIIFDENYEDVTASELANNICRDLKSAGYQVTDL